MNMLTTLAAIAAASYVSQIYLVRLALHLHQQWLARFAWPIAVVAIITIYLVDKNVLYPYRAPLRVFPQGKVNEGFLGLSLLTEQPRGKTSLKFFNEFPNADCVRLGYDAIIPQSPAALRDILVTNSYSFEKPAGARAWLARIIGYGLVCSEGAAHKEQRRLLNPAFNIKNIRAMYPLMWAKTSILCQRLEEEVAQHGFFDVTTWASRVTLDIIGVVACSCDFDSLNQPDQPIEEAFHTFLVPSRGMQLVFGLSLVFPAWIIRMLPLRANGHMDAAEKKLRDELDKILQGIKKRQAGLSSTSEKSTDRDIMDRVVEEGQFSDEQMKDQMATFLGAGHETTASSIAWVCHLLTLPEYKHYQALIRNEIRTNIPTATECPQHTVLDTLPYLNGLCEEILRLYPTVPNTARVCVQDTTVAGVKVERGTFVSIVPYAINRNPRFWGKDAHELRPERWIDTLSDGTKRFQKSGGTESNFCGVTFLHGPRSCIGQDFARAELRAVVAGLLGRFEISRLEGDTGEVIVGGTLTIKPLGFEKATLRRVEGW